MRNWPSLLPVSADRVAFAAATARASLLVGVAVTTALAPTNVHAQVGTGISFVATNTRRYEADGKTNANTTYPTPYQFAITKADCLSDRVFEFVVTPTGDYNSRTAEVWVAPENYNCSNEADRVGANRHCWRAGTRVLGPEPSISWQIRMRDILSQLSKTQPSENFEQGGVEVCDQPQLSSRGVKLNIRFVITGAGSSAISSDAFPIPVDVNGPGKPIVTAARGAANTIFIELDRGQSSSTTSEDGGSTGTESDLSTYVVYCNPVPQKEEGDAGPYTPADPNDPSVCTANPDAFTTVTAVADGGAVVWTAIDPKWKCAEQGAGTVRQLKVSDVKLGQPYQVAVVPTDILGNLGTPSDVRCAVPLAVSDFWDSYKESGGQAGGGYCSTGRWPSTAAWAGPAVLIAAIAAFIARRRRES